MPRWRYGDWAMAAFVVEDDGYLYPLSQLGYFYRLGLEGYYEERGWAASQYYQLDDLAGQMRSRYEGSFTIHAHLRITDGDDNTNYLHAECEGYTCCGEDCYMMLLVHPGRDAYSTTVEFKTVNEDTIRQAVGESWFDEWARNSTLVRLDEPPFPRIM